VTLKGSALFKCLSVLTYTIEVYLILYSKILLKLKLERVKLKQTSERFELLVKNIISKINNLYVMCIL
jgi:hypothetical protein